MRWIANWWRIRPTCATKHQTQPIVDISASRVDIQKKKNPHLECGQASVVSASRISRPGGRGGPGFRGGPQQAWRYSEFLRITLPCRRRASAHSIEKIKLHKRSLSSPIPRVSSGHPGPTPMVPPYFSASAPMSFFSKQVFRIPQPTYASSNALVLKLQITTNQTCLH